MGDLDVSNFQMTLLNKILQQLHQHITGELMEYLLCMVIIVCHFREILKIIDITDKMSLQNIKYWLSEIDRYANENVNRMLIGTKCDLTSKRMVTTQEAEELSDLYGIGFAETSSISGINVEEAVLTMTKQLLATIAG